MRGDEARLVHLVALDANLGAGGGGKTIIMLRPEGTAGAQNPPRPACWAAAPHLAPVDSRARQHHRPRLAAHGAQAGLVRQGVDLVEQGEVGEIVDVHLPKGEEEVAAVRGNDRSDEGAQAAGRGRHTVAQSAPSAPELW